MCTFKTNNLLLETLRGRILTEGVNAKEL